MEEHDRLEEESKVLVQTLKLMLVALGLVVMQFSGWSLFMPMMAGLAVCMAWTFAMRVLQRHGRL